MPSAAATFQAHYCHIEGLKCVALSFVDTWQFGDAVCGLPPYGLVQSNPISRSPIQRFICEFKMTLYTPAPNLRGKTLPCIQVNMYTENIITDLQANMVKDNHFFYMKDSLVKKFLKQIF
jgi:hypothetical protein